MTTDKDFTLKAPEAVPIVTVDKTVGLVPLNDEERSALDARVDAFVDDLIALPTSSPEFGQKVDALTSMGRAEIAEAASYSSRFLDRPIKAIGTETDIGADLTQLKRTVEDLDPARQGNLLAPRRLFGIIPFGSKLRNYFDGYQSSQSHIASILDRLASGKDELLRDNAAIDEERLALWKTMNRLEQMIYISKTLDKELERKADDLAHSDPAKAKAVKETALFYTRQRTTDLMTQMAVTVQGYLALDLVKKNNVELIKGVDRASTTTVSALRTAVTVAQALTSQKLVLEQISALNTTTSRIIDSTGDLLRSQTALTHEQAANATISLDTLKKAFQNIYGTMDSIDTFKLQSLGAMKETVEALSTEIEKSRGYIARAEGSRAELSTNENAAPQLTPLSS